MRSIVIGFGLLVLCLLILFKLASFNFMQGNIRLEVIVAIAAFVFFFVGLYFNQKFNKTKSAAPAQLVQENHTNFFVINYEEIKKRGITQREHDVLVKMAEGLSNQEIADQLYLSESTIKTHVSNLFVKLDAKRRTQAIQTARQLKIVDL